MTGPFDTVSDVRDWLDDDPPLEEVEEAIEVEEDGPKRKTALGALSSYADKAQPDNTVDFVVVRSHGDYSPGQSISLDPDSDEAVRLRRSGTIRLG